MRLPTRVANWKILSLFFHSDCSGWIGNHFNIRSNLTMRPASEAVKEIADWAIDDNLTPIKERLVELIVNEITLREAEVRKLVIEECAGVAESYSKNMWVCEVIATAIRNLESNMGWECPKCGGVMSPFHPTCWFCKPYKQVDDPNARVSRPLPDICSCHTTMRCPIHGKIGL
jgi:hypothetical protein